MLSSELYAIPALVGAAVVVVSEGLGVGGPLRVFAGAVAFPASDEAAYVTGREITVGGGMGLRA